jgi:hypothetical protein
MAEKQASVAAEDVHGASNLPSVIVDAYSTELRHSDGFLGDRASKRAFQAIMEDWRERLRRIDEDPLGDVPSDQVSKRRLEKILIEGDPRAAGMVHGIIEEFAQELATVTRRFLRLKSWHDTQRIVVGGGLRETRIGEIIVGRAGILLKRDGIEIDLIPIRNHPDEAGLIGVAHLCPSWVFSGSDGILAADIGGTNMRAGIVELRIAESADLAKAAVWESEQWRHAGDKPTRDEAVERLMEMFRGLIKRARKEKFRLAPFIGLGCPGLIREDGSIERGGQNLPGNWESSRFHLPTRLREGIPMIGDHHTAVILHNDAVVQGLSEVPFMQDVERWGVLTMGTGLGNARFTNRQARPATK